MQTRLSDQYAASGSGQEADAILRSCVHCGFCTATCPTYQLLGDELDSPRGRIYLIKQLLEGNTVTRKTQLHLDRCLSCRACETTCPSGVKYARLLDIGRNILDQQVSRASGSRLLRKLLRTILPHAKWVRFFVTVGRILKPILPAKISAKLPTEQKAKPWPAHIHHRKMLLMQACVQSVATPATNAATASILHKLGIQAVVAPHGVCCGAISQHLSAPADARDYMRRNIDAWWPFIEQGIEAIVITASGCGVMVKEYGHLLADDKLYADKACRVSELCRDLCELLPAELGKLPTYSVQHKRVAFHSPCTLQHGLQLNGRVEQILTRIGYTLVPVADAHLCCGSAGTYSLLQPKLSQRLLSNKVAALNAGKPEIIATANIGCQLHLASQMDLPVKHWIELADAALTA